MKPSSLLGLAAGILLLAAFTTRSVLHRSAADAQSAAAPASEMARRCPVCGMFVDRHLAWLAEIRFTDGQSVVFDGAKDMFTYYLDLARYAPKRTRREIESVRVTDYYSLGLIDGTQARYVVGSEVLGPMGHELIPLRTEPAACEFLRDHHGRQILSFSEVNPEVLTQLPIEASRVSR